MTLVICIENKIQKFKPQILIVDVLICMHRATMGGVLFELFLLLQDPKHSPF